MDAAKEDVCLQWNDYEANLSAAFKELKNDKDLTNVTLATENDGNLGLFPISSHTNLKRTLALV